MCQNFKENPGAKGLSFVFAVLQSFLMEQLGSHWTYFFYEILNLSIFLENQCGKILVSLKPDKNNWYITWRPIYTYDNIKLSCY